MVFYAQINDEKICVGVSQLSGKVEHESMIEIESYDTELLGKKYEGGEWVEVEDEEGETTEMQ